MGRGQIVQKLVECCLRMNAQQRELIKILNAAVLPNVQTDIKDIVNKLLYLEHNITENKKYSMCGAIILQKLLFFNVDYTQYIIDSFMKLESDQLVVMAVDPVGSKVLDAFLDCGITVERKHQFIKKLKGRFPDIGVDKCGSFVMERIYKLSDLSLREMICEELAKEEPRLFSTPAGRYVLLICHINVFKKKKDQWASSQATTDKKRKLFQDILEDDGASTTSTKQQQQQPLKKQKNIYQHSNKDENEDEDEDKVPVKVKKEKIGSDDMNDQSNQDADMDDIDMIFNSKSKSSKSTTNSSQNFSIGKNNSKNNNEKKKFNKKK
ncbi:hypothetical protein PPL_04555 [Heterostelium album PN500]|uniref:Uncharacterized protein n=1 Tax=Heterostelium pallidum (strain ATCC 26659 / Pp 5 / PN500) TaxID=670386 RepID=D3B7W7_HETP5|nr:hypothetical protein PPL_04555 [Heterostelium album PN500]EFA82860.1 hypothetical protein PPL_04555 [Heterostelium album PN500]|eukprot:XP_020434977.1 hypothetical protein PPL_04555 [Heterostelium album PN500]